MENGTNCPKCGGSILYLLSNDSGMLGLYCKECNRWLKWVGKRDEVSYRNKYVDLTGSVKKVVGGAVPVRDIREIMKAPCVCCGCVESKEVRVKGNNTGLFCKECGKYYFWLNKEEKRMLRIK